MMSDPSAKPPTSLTPQRAQGGQTNTTNLDPTVIPNQVSGPSTELVAGTMLGPYCILKKLGEGGMGAVYQAQHSKLDKIVAVKVLSSSVTNQPGAVSRFEREMKAVGKLNHPNIVQAFDAGEISGTHYLAMEFIDGTDLLKLIQERGPLSVINACKVIRQAAQALAAAHQAGLVHRDIKPSNLLVAKNGQIKLLDLGLARLAGEASSQTSDLTQSGQAFGTPDYMAPEQWEDAHSADARTDLYALGCTLYFLLTKRAPYDSDTHRSVANKMKGHIIDVIPDLKAARNDVPDEVLGVYQKLMEKKPANRFQNATELVEALSAIIASKNSSTLSPTTTATATTPVDPPINITISPVVKPKPASAGSRGRSPGQFVMIAGGVAGFVVLLGVIIITITSKDGKKTKIEIPAGTKYKVKAGPGEEVEIASQPDPTPPPTPPAKPAPLAPIASPADLFSKDFSNERALAEYVHTHKGTVYVTYVSPPDQGELIPADKPLPKEDFLVSAYNALVLESVSRYDLQELTRGRRLRHVGFQANTVDPQAIPLLAGLGHAWELSLFCPNLKTSTFPAFPGVFDLILSGEMVDDQWAFLERCPQLRVLTIKYPEAALPDLTPLGNYHQLRIVNVGEAPLDATLVTRLQQANPRLRLIGLKDGQWQAFGNDPVDVAAKMMVEHGGQVQITQLDKIFKGISHDPVIVTKDTLTEGRPWRVGEVRFPAGSTITPAILRELSAFAGTLSMVGLDQQSNGDELVSELIELKWLFGLVITNCDLSDSGLLNLQTFDRLSTLSIQGNPRITPAGIQAFHVAVPACRILSDHGEILPDYTVAPRKNGP